MVRERLIIKGDIAEGGIRYFAQMKASGLSLSGFSKRGQEGSILIEAQGQREKIEKLKEILKVGNGFFKVSTIESEEIDIIENEKSFLIK